MQEDARQPALLRPHMKTLSPGACLRLLSDMLHYRVLSRWRHPPSSQDTRGLRVTPVLVRLLLFLIVIAVLTVLITSLARDYLNVHEVSVPDVVGEDIEVAYRRLRALDLEVFTLTQDAPDARVNSVVTQNPSPGALVRPGRSVSLAVYAPPAEVSMPTLVGLTSQDAALRLAEANLRLSETAYVFSDRPQGEIITQNPAAGSRLGGEPRITIEVSRGAEVVERDLPDVTNLPLREARGRLERAGFRNIEVVADEISFRRANEVRGQSPRAGQSLPVTTPITLSYAVSSQDVIRIPDIAGRSLRQAQLMLRAAGLDVAWVDYVDQADQPQGVLEVRPTGYTLPGTPIAVTFNGAAGGDNALLAPRPNARPGGDAGETAGDIEDDVADGGGQSRIDELLEQLERDTRTEADGADADTNADLPAGGRSVRIAFNPADYGFLQGRDYNFRLVVIDDEGTRDAIDRDLAAGDTVNTSVTIFGSAELQVFINDILFQAWTP